MATLVEDTRTSADWIAEALQSSGYSADFSLASLREVDRFFAEQSREGKAIPNGLLSENLGSRMFAIGSYVGEAIRRVHGGHWQADDEDPKGEINITLVLPGGGRIWPVQRVMKRFKNGAEDGIYGYAVAMGDYTEAPTPAPGKKPWWRFW
jgi:hypothetical protein